MRNPSRMSFTVAALVGMVAASGAAYAADPFVPQTGSSQGIIVPHATPGEPTHRHSADEGHLIAPTGLTPLTGSAQGVTPPNAVPGARAALGEAQPHADVVSPRSEMPDTGQEQSPSR